MDQVNVLSRGPFKESPRGSSAESDNAQARQRVPARSSDTRRQGNERGREIVTNGASDSRADHYSAAADFESESPPRREDGHMRQPGSTSSNPKPSEAAASTIPYSHSATYAEMNGSSTTPNSQRQTTSTGQYKQMEQGVRKLTNSDSHSFVSTAPHNGSRVDIGAMTAQAEDVMQGSFKKMGALQQAEYDTFLRRMNERAGVLEDLEHHLQWYINAFHQVNHEKERIILEKDGIIREKERMVHERSLLQGQVKDLEDQVARLQQQLQVQNQKPVVPVNAYSTHTADGASGADVIGAVQQLNEEIFQCAALLADEYQGLPEECRKLNRDETITRDLQDTFGYTIAGFVSRAKNKGEHSWIEHALQTCIIACCMGSLTSLNPPPYKGHRSSVDDLYHAIRHAEDQGVSGKWRSLACRHGSKRAKEKVKMIKNAIPCLCEFLGWPRWRSDSQHIDALKLITLKTISLREMIYTEVLSGDMVVIFPEPDTPFDPDTMEINDNRNAHAKPTTGEPIICTTDMGLIKLVVEKRQLSDGKWKYGEEKTVILKAKVALRNSLPDDPNERAEVYSRSHMAREFGYPFSR